jgi:inositol phosphorylceramide mannosyltransferase catalytic subunit
MLNFSQGLKLLGCIVVLESFLFTAQTISIEKPACFNINFDTIMQNAYLNDYRPNEYANMVFKQLYDNYIVNDFQYSEQPRIPKIIHQMWFSGAVPEKYWTWQQTWKKNHPDWQYILWTKEMIEQLDMINKDKFMAARNIATKADIARYEVLYKFGGLYVDLDMECIKPMDVFHHCCDFYASCYHHGQIIEICAFAARPGHPLLKTVLQKLRRSNPAVTSMAAIMNNTGNFMFTPLFLEYVKKANDRCVIFPAPYLLPLPYTFRFKEANINHPGVQKWLKPESYAIHYWGASWSPMSFKKSVDDFLSNSFE